MDVRGTLAALLVVGLLAASLYAWIGMFLSRFRWPAVAWQFRQPVPWGAVELLVGIVLFILTFAVLLGGPTDVDLPPSQREGTKISPHRLEKGQAAVTEQSDVRRNHEQADTPSPHDVQWRRRIAYDMVARLFWCAVTIALVKAWKGARASDFGWPGTISRQDLSIGWHLFVLAAPGIYGLQAVLLYFWPKQHPLIELLQHSDDALLWLLTGISVIAVAPVVEEFAFRALFQGWLEKICHVHTAEACGAVLCETGFMQPSPGPIPEHWRLLVPPLSSAAVFAGLHADQGPAWIPLFFFGLILGFLYLRTHRLLPCITLHALLNGYSFLLLILVAPSGK